jgi:hypothetical protein
MRYFLSSPPVGTASSVLFFTRTHVSMARLTEFGSDRSYNSQFVWRKVAGRSDLLNAPSDKHAALTKQIILVCVPALHNPKACGIKFLFSLAIEFIFFVQSVASVGAMCGY